MKARADELLKKLPDVVLPPKDDFSDSDDGSRNYAETPRILSASGSLADLALKLLPASDNNSTSAIHHDNEMSHSVMNESNDMEIDQLESNTHRDDQEEQIDYSLMLLDDDDTVTMRKWTLSTFCHRLNLVVSNFN
jgi:hypothetical protein